MKDYTDNKNTARKIRLRIYSGNWENDQKEGKGVLEYENGDKYTGRWLKGKKSG